MVEKHILVCVSDDAASSYSLHFVRKFFDSPCDVRMTLLFVSGVGSGNKGKSLLEKSRKWFEEMQFCDKSKIDIKTLPSHGSIAKMIVQEGHKGMYDAVLVGRRNSSLLEELFDYSVSHRLLWEEVGFPIWFCCEPAEEKRSGVLLCVDDDAPSMRMSDHVGFILGDNPKHGVTLMHVDNGSGINSKKVFLDSRAALNANGVDDSRITEITVKERNIFKAIKEQSAKGHYAVVAVGRGQHKKSALETVMPASLSVKLLRAMSPENLWISK